MNPTPFLIAAFLAHAIAASAAEGIAEPVPKYELKKRSYGQFDPAARPPFWPIGWVKRTAGGATPQAAAAPVLQLKEEGFVVTSILTGNPSLAVINGRSYSEGEFVRMPKKGPPIKVRVMRIHDGFVQLRSEDQLLSPKLRREVLTPKEGIEEPLLNDEE